ncbi:MAG TPA: LD-carboxypeptidase [Thermoanaerobaculia bacterium]|nr:LD-carboxypeptidase [Thermoanaerobaculia bacterium]
MIKPPRLEPGATVGVAAISGPVRPARLEAGLESLRAKGYRVVEASNLRRREGFLAGTDAERAAGYRELLTDPAVDAVFFARGGYGAARTLPLLDSDLLRAHPKIHLGGSDLTALFAFASGRVPLVTFYGPMVAVQMADGADLDWEAVLAGNGDREVELSPSDRLAPGVGEGPLVGGCLSLVASLCGTPDAVQGAGSVFFWEDVGEEIYRLDRMLTQLERSGTFDRLEAMLIGTIAPGRAGTESPAAVRAWLAERFEASPFPVLMGFPAGHSPDTRTIPLGAKVRLDADRGTVRFLEAGVA